MKFTIQLTAVLLALLYSTFAAALCSNPVTNITITKPDSMYTDNGNGTVTDHNTGLMWQKCPLGLSGPNCTTGTQQRLNWLDAHQAANINNDSGFSDWRVPNKNELNSLVEYACTSPAINDSFFPNGYVISGIFENFWTSTPIRPSPRAAWFVNFQSGLTWVIIPDEPQNKDSLFMLRLVRGVVPLDITPPSQPIFLNSIIE